MIRRIEGNGVRRVGTTGAVARVGALTRALALALVLSFAAGVPARAAALHWSSPVRINAAPGDEVYNAVACPTAGLCLAADQDGRVAVTTQPRADATWHVSRLISFPSLAQTPLVIGLACAGAHLCVSVDAGGYTYSSSDPTGGPGAWRATALPGGDSAAAIACPAEQLCVAPSSHSAAVDTWIDPRPGRRWVHTELPRGAAPAHAVSCPSAAECVIGTDGGRVLTSTDPAAGGASYVAHRVTATGTSAITAVTCPATGGCLAGDGRGEILSTADPAGPDPWGAQSVAPGASIRSIGCAPSGGCVAVDSRGRLYARAAGATAWVRVAADPAGPAADQAVGADAVACPSDGFCVTADGTGALPRSATPFTASGWRTGPPRTDAGGRLSGIACPSLALCVAVGSGGEAVASRTPLRAGSWRTVTADRVDGVRGVSCPSTAFCLATDPSGGVVISTDAGAGVWRRHTIIGDQGGGNGVPTGLQGVSCASAHFCLTGDANPGDLLTATNPWGGPRAWRHDPGAPVTEIAAACPSARFCVVVDAAGGLDAFRPGRGRDVRYSTPGPGSDAVACPSTRLCVTASGGFADSGTGGGVWASTDPAAARPRWHHAVPDASDAPAIACHARAICAAVDYAGRALVSGDPAAPRPHWETETVDPQAVLTGVACPAARVCLAVDRDGRLHIGT